MDYLTTHTSLSSIRRGFAPGFVNYKKGCTRLEVASDKVYKLLAHGRWFSLVTPNQIINIHQIFTKTGADDFSPAEIVVAVLFANQLFIPVYLNGRFDLI